MGRVLVRFPEKWKPVFAGNAQQIAENRPRQVSA
jgi:hypothetical protein